MFKKAQYIALFTMCGLALVGFTSAAYALFNGELHGISFQSTPAETKILLKSDVAIPHKVVSHNNERIILELNKIDTSKSVQTDFASVETINHVILKPLSNNRLRIVIRGHHLGTPAVSFTTQHAVKPATSRPVFSDRTSLTTASTQASARVKTPTDTETKAPPVTQQASTETDTSTAEELSESSTDTATIASSDDELNTLLQEEEAHDAAAISLPPLSDRSVISNRKHSAEVLDLENTQLPSLQESFSDSSMGAWLVNILQSDFLKKNAGLIFRFSIIGGLLIFLLTFIHNKLQRRSPFQEPQQKRSAGLMSSIIGQQDPPPAPQQRPRRENRGSRQRPLGLSGLIEEQPERPIQNNTPLQKRQALSQYSKHAPQPAPKRPKRNGAALDRELQRSIHMKYATETTQKKPYQQQGTRKKSHSSIPSGANQFNETRKPIRQPSQPYKKEDQLKQPKRRQRAEAPTIANTALPKNPSQGLPSNNNEVLDFLRSVADLMEQGGKTDLAQDIKRGIQANGQA